jgi:hypothetical protein
MDKKLQLLCVLLVLLALSVAYRVTHPFRQARVKQLTHNGKSTPAVRTTGSDRPVRPPATPATPTEKGIEPHDHDPPAALRVTRNPFAVKPPVSGQADPAPGAAAPQTDPLVQVRQELGEFNVFGSYSDQNGTALFLKRDTAIYLVRQGDLLENRYRVAGISPERLDLRILATGEAVHIDLSEFNASRYGLAEAAGDSGGGPPAPAPEEPPVPEEAPPNEPPEQSPVAAPQPPPAPEPASSGPSQSFKPFGSINSRTN